MGFMYCIAQLHPKCDFYKQEQVEHRTSGAVELVGANWPVRSSKNFNKILQNLITIAQEKELQPKIMNYKRLPSQKQP